MIDDSAQFTSPQSTIIKGGSPLMTEKPVTNVIEFGTQAEFEPVSPLSGENTPIKNLFSPRPDGTKRPVNEKSHAQL